MQNYKAIRLEFNEGKIQPEGSTRHEWKDSVKDLPAQERPSADESGYNKHYYEIMRHDGSIIKFRLDVEHNNYMDTLITEEEVARVTKN